MTGKAKKTLAALLSALVVLAPEMGSSRAFAQMFEARPVVRLPTTVAPAASAAVSAAASATRSATLSGPVSAVPSYAAAAPAAAMAAPPQAAAAPAAPAEPGTPAGVPAAATPASAPAGAERPAAAVTPIDSGFKYKAHRLLLSMVAALSGGVHSLRPAGPALTERAIASASGAQAVLTDYDETLADSNAAFSNVLPEDMVGAIRAVHAAGKTVDVISDRPETVLKSLSSLPVDARAGMFAAVDAGGRVYRFDNHGEPKLVFTAPGMTAEAKSVIANAAQAALPQLAAAGAELYAGATPEDGAQVWREYTYTLKLKPGSAWETVRDAGATLQRELAAQGSKLTVRARMAKDPSNPPYLVVSVASKAAAARYIAGQRGLAAKDVVILGDGMYAPAAPARSWAGRLGERLSGRALPDQGNGSDAEMEKGVPGAKVFSVGGTGDPRRAGMLVLGRKGPAAARRVLEAVASKPAVVPPAPNTFFHEIALWFKSLRHYFIEVNVENWREYRTARAASPVVRAGSSAVKATLGRNLAYNYIGIDAERGRDVHWESVLGDMSRGASKAIMTVYANSGDSRAPRFFAETRMMGQIGGAHIVGSRSGSDAYVRDEANRLFQEYFTPPELDEATRVAFEMFLSRAVLYNPMRSSSNLRKHIRKALHAASMLPREQLAAFFDSRLQGEVNDAAQDFQRDEAPRVLGEFRAAVEATVLEEDVDASDRVLGIVLLGSFATGSATPASDFDMHVLSADGGSARVVRFLERLERRWSLNPESKAHPLNGADFAFIPSRLMLLRLHHDPFLVISPDQRLERNLSPPEGWHADRTRPDGPTFREKVSFRFFNALLRTAMLIDDLRTALRPTAAAASVEYTPEQLGDLIAARLKSTGIRAIITDYDGTLMNKTPDDKAVVASERLLSLLAALRRKGIMVALSTNHFFTGDHNGMDHLIGDRLDAQTRAGMSFVVQSGARIYEYGADGAKPAEPAWKETPFDDAERAKITPIFLAAAAKAGLAPDDVKIYHEDSRSLIEVRDHFEKAEALYAELTRANVEYGFKYLVQLKPMPTMRHVPYVQYFKAHKGTGAKQAVARMIAQGLIDDESQVLILGDDFKPEGNDLYMAQSLPKALAVSVSQKWDASQPNVVQSKVRGADAVQDLLARLNALLPDAK